MQNENPSPALLNDNKVRVNFLIRSFRAIMYVCISHGHNLNLGHFEMKADNSQSTSA